jgi:hypothetical protein
MAGIEKLPRTERDRHPRANVVAERCGTQKRRAVSAHPFRHRERGGNDAASRVDERGRMRVVSFIGMCQHPSGESGICGRRDDARTWNARFGCAALSLHIR